MVATATKQNLSKPSYRLIVNNAGNVEWRIYGYCCHVTCLPGGGASLNIIIDWKVEKRPETNSKTMVSKRKCLLLNTIFFKIETVICNTNGQWW